jgi:phospholipid transport system substrate-binding protein
MLAVVIATTLLAAAPSPLEVVRAGYTRVQEAANKPGATVEQLAGAVDRFVDFEELARRALGETWNTLTPGQRKEFTGEMRAMLRAFYAQRALGSPGAQMTYGEERIEGREAAVSTLLKVKGTSIPMVYKLYKPARKASGWRVYDVVTDKSSLLENYRIQFRKLLADKGFEGLLATLKARRAQVERSAPVRK